MTMLIEPLITAAAAPGAVTGTLFAWFSPAFPTGAFAYSHGLETAVAEGRIKGEAGLAAWIGAILVHGAGWSDAVLLRLAHAASLAGRPDGLDHVIDLAAALAPSGERLAEALGQGQAFLDAVRCGWPGLVPEYAPRRISLPAAAGVATAGLGADVCTAVSAYLTGFCANQVATGIRLNLCGQMGGVRIMAGLGDSIARLARRAERADEDDLGGCAIGADIASMRHESLDGRLFRS
jgi:urease accessory protein